MDYKYVTFVPPKGPATKQDDAITDELNRWTRRNWRVGQVLRPDLDGPINIVLTRETAADA